MRVAIVAGMPAPYRIPVWNAVADRVHQLDVVLMSRNESNRIWLDADLERARFNAQVLRGIHYYVQRLDWGFHWNPSIVRTLRRLSPDRIVCNGYDTPTYLAAALYARRVGIPLTYSWEGHALGSRVRQGIVARIRRRAAGLADSVLAHGAPGARYIRSMGVDDRRIVTGILPVDVDSFAAAANAPPSADGRVRFLYVGQFIPRKGVTELVQAFAQVPREQATLTLVGYGPQEAELRALVDRLALDNVTFAGPTRTADETARAYAAADVLVMPSHLEVWGLVVNEALAAGLYVLASDVAGVTQDLITDAPVAVGLSFAPGSSERLASAVLSAIHTFRTAPPDRREISSWGQQHTPDRLAGKLVDAMDLAAALRQGHRA